MRSSLETYDVETGEVRVVWQTDDLIEAPNWDNRAGALIVNGGGRLFRVSLGGGEVREIDTGALKHLNNDHGLSPDGRRIVVSDNIPGRGSVIYTLPAAGGAPVRITDEPGAYWHGWSPDGATLAYCGKRNGQFDIYTVGVEGGAETQLTGLSDREGHNDGPDFSPDGAWIWFNSDRTGHAQIWKMRRDGSDGQQMTDDDAVNWFPHPSPDGAWILYLAYPPGTEQHPRDRDVTLRLMRPNGSEMRDVLSFNGGQGTINVPCWTADGRSFAFVRYEKP